jgi:gluconolactonase
VLCGHSATSVETLVVPGATVVKVLDGFKFTEGPAWDGKRALYFTDIPNERIHKWEDGKLSVFREKSGRANGLYFDKEGALVMCEGGGRRLSRATMGGEVSVLAEAFEGKKLNSPNDLWIDPSGGVYFTDPRYGKRDDLEQGGFHVYYLASGGKEIVRVIDDLEMPNGIIGTKDGRKLYVADPGAGKTYVYTIKSPGVVADRKVAADEGSDGITLDSLGNLYLTQKMLHIFGPDGKRIAMIAVPEAPSNVTFGGRDGRTLFITAR